MAFKEFFYGFLVRDSPLLSHFPSSAADLRTEYHVDCTTLGRHRRHSMANYMQQGLGLCVPLLADLPRKMGDIHTGCAGHQREAHLTLFIADCTIIGNRRMQAPSAGCRHNRYNRSRMSSSRFSPPLSSEIQPHIDAAPAVRKYRGTVTHDTCSARLRSEVLLS